MNRHSPFPVPISLRHLWAIPLALGCLAAGPSPATAPATRAATTAAPQLYLDTLDLKKATQSTGETRAKLSSDGNGLTLRGRTFAHGIGTHAESTLVIDLKGAAKAFAATVGIDDEAADEGSAGFTVIGDGKVLLYTHTLTRADAAKKISVDLTGVKQLVLKVDSGDDDNTNGDDADWADALITLDPAKADAKPETVAASQAKMP